MGLEDSYILTYHSYGLKLNNDLALDIYPDLALMVSTSGSTGSPKMVKLTKDNLYNNTDSIIKYLGINEKHRVITNLPLHYSYGISIVNTHLEGGGSIVVCNESIMSKTFWEVLKDKKVTTLNGVPYNYEIFKP